MSPHCIMFNCIDKWDIKMDEISLFQEFSVGLVKKAGEAFSSEMVKKSIDELWKKILTKKWKHGTESAKEYMRKFYENEYENYFDSSIKKYLLIRTLNKRHEDVYLGKIYYPLNIKHDNETLCIKDGFIYENDNITNIIGVAGQGKSTILKKIFMESLFNSSEANKIPIFFDLRDFAGTSIKQNLKEILSTDDDKIIDELLSSGNLLLILDGFDEVGQDDRRDLLNDIVSLNLKHKVQIITSSRPNTEICTKPGIKNYTVSYLTEDDVCKMLKNLVSPTKYPHLIEALEKNTQLLQTITTPILVILFCTCEQYLDTLPTDAKEFYGRVFFILYEGHDDTKEFYGRSKLSEYTASEMRDIFSCFCFISQYEDKTSFSDYDFYDISRRALISKKQNDNSKVAECFARDIVNVTGLIKKDGYEHNVFIHRTIQEFHAAEYIKSSASRKKSEINKMLVASLRSDRLWLGVAKFLMLSDRDNSIDEILLPLCESREFGLWKDNKNRITKELYDEYLDEAYVIVSNKEVLRTSVRVKRNFNGNNKGQLKKVFQSIEVGPFNEGFRVLIELLNQEKQIKIQNFNDIITDVGLTDVKSLEIMSELNKILPGERMNVKNSIKVSLLMEKSNTMGTAIALFKNTIDTAYEELYLYYKEINEATFSTSQKKTDSEGGLALYL